MAELIETRGGGDDREKKGGEVLCAAEVASIVTDPDPERRAVRGVTVRVASKETFFVPCGVVVSAVGFENTFLRLVPRETLRAAGMDPREVTSRLRPSHGHVCAFVSLDGSASGSAFAPPTRTVSATRWGGFGYDVGAFSRDYYADPFRDDAKNGVTFEPLITITCPSAKDPSRANDPTSTVILLAEAVAEWTDPSWRVLAVDATGVLPGVQIPVATSFSRTAAPTLPEDARARVSRGGVHASHRRAVPGKRRELRSGVDPAHFEAETQERWFSPAVRRVPGLFLTGECVAYGGFYGAVANAYVTASHVLGLARLATMMATDGDAEPPVVRERRGKDEDEDEDEDDVGIRTRRFWSDARKSSRVRIVTSNRLGRGVKKRRSSE